MLVSCCVRSAAGIGGSRGIVGSSSSSSSTTWRSYHNRCWIHRQQRRQRQKQQQRKQHLQPPFRRANTTATTATAHSTSSSARLSSGIGMNNDSGGGGGGDNSGGSMETHSSSCLAAGGGNDDDDAVVNGSCDGAAPTPALAAAAAAAAIRTDRPCWATSNTNGSGAEASSGDGNSGEERQNQESAGFCYSLPGLLKLLDRSRCVLLENDDYVAVDKPPDLRMDGPYPATVHKLLAYWYPPEQLRRRAAAMAEAEANERARRDERVSCSEVKNEDDDGSGNCEDGAALLRLVSRLHRHGDPLLPPPEDDGGDGECASGNEKSGTATTNSPSQLLRPCHQLDYATSGVLLTARSRKAADAARRAFEGRTARKAYKAIVHGHVGVAAMLPTTMPGEGEDGAVSGTSNGDSGRYLQHPLPTLSEAELEEKMRAVEGGYRRDRHRRGKKKDTFDGYQPAHSIFQQWQHRQRRRREESDVEGKEGLTRAATGDESASRSQTKKRRRKARGSGGDEVKTKQRQSHHQLLGEDDWEKIWGALDLPPSGEGGGGSAAAALERLVDGTWKDAKAAKLAAPFQRAADAYNAILRDRMTAAPERKQREESAHSDGVGDGSLQHLPTAFRVAGEGGDESSASASFYVFAPLAEVEGQFAMLLPPNLRRGPAEPPSAAEQRSVGDDDGLAYKPALTKCIVLSRTYIRRKRGGGDDVNHMYPVTKVRLEPRTGRRHQLRVHLALLGHPIVGDGTYCNSDGFVGDDLAHRMCLHSESLQIPFEGGKTLKVTARDPFVEKDGEVVVESL